MKISKKFYFIIGLLLLVNLYAKEIPIRKVVEINLPLGVPSIIDFPFIIKAVKATSFIYKVKKKNVDELDDLQPLQTNNKQKKQKRKQPSIINTQRPILISRTKRIMTITPKKEGKMSLIIWGYKYPIVLDIRTKLMKNNEYDRYITFLDYSKDKEKAKVFESTSHEKVITKLIRYIYNNKVPQGYQYQAGTLEYKTNGLELMKIKSLIGYRYKVEEWVVENETKNSIILYPEMFYNNGIYAVTFENNKLKPKEKIRMFIVRQK